MKIGKFNFRLGLWSKRGIVTCLLLFVVSCSAVLVTSIKDVAPNTRTRIFEPGDSKTFIFEPGQKSFDIEIGGFERCSFRVGIWFASLDDGREIDRPTIRDVFGAPFNLFLPAVVDISLFDDSGKSVFSIMNYGGSDYNIWKKGSKIGAGYGSTLLYLYFGRRVRLEPGRYTAILNIKEVERDFSEFETGFIVMAGYTDFGTCGYGSVLNVTGSILKMLQTVF